MNMHIDGLLSKGTRGSFRALLKMQFKSGYNISKLSENIGLGEGKRKYVYLYLVLMFLAFIPFSLMLFKFADTLAKTLITANQPGLVVVIAVMISQLLVIFLGLSHLISTLYYSNDLEALQAFPLTAWQIMGAKIFVVYIGQLIGVFFLVAPFLITLGINLGQVPYWFLALPVFILIPAIPLAFSLLFTIPIMKVTAGARKRDLLRVLLGLLVFVLMMSFQYLNTSFARYDVENLVIKLMERDGLVSAAAGYYPILKWAAWTLTGKTLGIKLFSLFLYTAVSLVLLVFVVALSQRWFFGGIAAEKNASYKKVLSKRLEKFSRILSDAKSPMLSLILKEHRLLVRTPVFLLTSLLNLLILPIMAVPVYLSGAKELVPFLEMAIAAEAKHVAVIVVVFIHGMFIGLNQIASTAVSREGQMFWFSKMIPISPKTQVFAKLTYSMLFAFVQLAIITVASIWLLDLNLIQWLLLVILGIMISLPTGAICLLNDLRNPKLKWSDPQQAMKGNFQTLVAWLFSMLYLGLLGIILRGFYLFGMSVIPLYAMMGFFLAVSSYAFILMLEQASESAYVRL